MTRVPELHQADRFFTITVPAEDAHLVHGSKFIGIVAPAETETAAGEVLNGRRRRYPDATHNCWAWRVGRPGDLGERSSDDGEPSGTAGRPILDSLRGAGLENVVCVVTRYFGGTKLGTGGLARAYSDTAHRAMVVAKPVTRTVVRSVEIAFAHERTGVVYRALDEFGLHLEAGVYDAQAHGLVRVPLSQVVPLRQRLDELTLGGIEVTEGELGIV